MSWIDIGPLEAIPLRGARKIKTHAGCIAIFRTGEEEVYATTGTCPHKDGPLDEGIVHDRKITCPLHNMVFDLTTGEAIGEDHRLTTYPVRVEAGRVLIDGATLTRQSAA